MRSRHPQVHRLNRPILEALSGEHPAVRALRIHVEARKICTGLEIPWPNHERLAVEQIWISQTDGQRWTFSRFAHSYIAFDLVLGGWLPEPDGKIQPFEAEFLNELSRLRQLLDECDEAAQADKNDRVAPLILKAREFFDAYEAAIIARVGPNPVMSNAEGGDSLWKAGRNGK
jgi:hypothetical protein